MLNNNVKNYSIIFRDGSSISITQAQYTFYTEEIELKKHNDFIKIEDIDTKEILFEGRCNEIVRFKERKQDPKLYGAVYICDFNERHPLSEGGECNCMKKYDCIGCVFVDKIRKLGYHINTYRDITSEMKKKYLNNL